MRSIFKCDTLLDKRKYTLMHKEILVASLTVEEATPVASGGLTRSFVKNTYLCASSSIMA